MGDTASGRRFLTFRIAERIYAAPAEDVAEIIPLPRVARLPHAPKSLLGLANLRGAVIPLVDTRVMLGQAPFTPEASARAIVLMDAARGTNVVALAVDAVEQLVRPEAGTVETARPELTAEAGEILLGAFQNPSDRSVVKILDLPALLAAAFADRRAPRGPAAPAAHQHAATLAAAVEERLLISFEVAGQDYALPIDAVREIILLPDQIAIVPRAEAVLLGVAAWRETLLPLLSLRGLLGLAPAASRSGAEKVLVAIVNGAPVGLVADRARALIRADAAAIDPAPAMLSARGGGEAKITAIYRADGGRHLVSLLAPELLFREDVMRRIGDSFTAPVASFAEPAAGATAQFVVFRLGSEEFGLPIAAVDEVALVPEQLTRVPKMPGFLEGVINLRGEVLPVVDQRRRFEMPAHAGDATGRLIVVRTDRHRAGLIVDSVSEVLRASVDAIEPPPELTGEGALLVNGVINTPLNGRMILLLEPNELLTRSEHGVLDGLDLPDGSRAA